jgi:hypothetical protein
MIGGVGSVRGLTVMIATEGIFVWCAVTPTGACKHCQQCLCTVSTLPTRRSKNVGSPEKINRVFLVIGNPLKKDIQLSRATCIVVKVGFAWIEPPPGGMILAPGGRGCVKNPANARWQSCERSVCRGLRAYRLGSTVGDMMRTRRAQGDSMHAWLT